MNNRIKPLVLELLRSGIDPDQIKDMLSMILMLSDSFNDLDKAMKYVADGFDHIDYYQAIKDADHRP